MFAFYHKLNAFVTLAALDNILLAGIKMADDSLVPVCSATETPTEARATGGMSVNLNAADAGPAMMLTVSHVPVGQVDETGDGVEKLCNSSAPSGKKEPGLLAFGAWPSLSCKTFLVLC